MARINKKTRIKGLPVKILLKELESRKNSNTFFDDTLTINFISSTINLGSQVSNFILSQSSYVNHGQDISSSLNAPGRLIKGISDQYIDYSSSENIEPYRDYNQFASDGKSLESSFYSTGSLIEEVGEGFDEPLWSKNKIEIDISSNFINTHKTFVSYSLVQTIAPGSSHFGKNYNMCYYNFTNKCWDGIGVGLPINGTGISQYSTIGFTPSVLNIPPILGSSAFNSITASFEKMTAAGNPTTSFGFPFHPKFHATSSQLYSLTNVIDKPFLIEKIVILLSASFSFYPEIYTTSSFYIPSGTISSLALTTLPACINNIFILNQKQVSPLNYFKNTNLTASFPTNILLTSTDSVLTNVKSSRDLLTWGGITSFGNNIPITSYRGPGSYKLEVPNDYNARTENPKELLSRDYNFSSSLDVTNNLVNLTWSGSIKLELNVKNPVKLDSSKNLGYFRAAATTTPQTVITIRSEAGTKNGFSITKPTGRDLKSPISVLNLIEENEEDLGGSVVFLSKDSFSQNNPYILFPTDQLVLGWQQPLMNNQVNNISGSTIINNILTGSFSEISFHPGEAKMTIYGSYIKEGKENHNFSNEILKYNNVYEIIG